MSKNTALAGITVLIWATLAPLAKVLLTDIPSMETLFLGGLFAFLFLLGYNVTRGKLHMIRRLPPRTLLHMSGLGFLGLFLYSALYYYGLKHLSSQEACILNYLWPIMTVLFTSLLLKERLTWGKMIALICSFAGIIILSYGGSHGNGEHITAGIIACIVAAACYGLFSALNKKADLDQDLTMMFLWLTVTVCSGSCAALSGNWVPIHGLQWAGILWLGVVVNAVAYLSWALAINGSENTASIANLAFLVPLLSMILSVAFLKEPFKIRSLLAMIFIVGGILLQSKLDAS